MGKLLLEKTNFCQFNQSQNLTTFTKDPFEIISGSGLIDLILILYNVLSLFKMDFC